MIIRTLKLKLNSSQEQKLESWLWHLTGVWNWAIRKIELDAKDGVYHGERHFAQLLKGHGEKVGLPAHTLQSVLYQAYDAWRRYFKRLGGKPRLKGNRNKLNSIPVHRQIEAPIGTSVKLPLLGKLRFHKQDLPEAKIKMGRIIRRASGWYLCLWLDTTHAFPVKQTTEKVGIDPGFSTLLTLSNGTKIANPRELRLGAKRLAQAQRGGRKKLAARLHERQANRRSDRNHKISRKLVENYHTICYSADNFKAIAKRFGKSVTEAGLGQLIGHLSYKCRTGGRTLVPVSSRFTTMTCSNCGARNGPTGLGGLAVRHWECACGAHHDRDVNAAVNILNAGAGLALNVLSDRNNRQELLPCGS